MPDQSKSRSATTSISERRLEDLLAYPREDLNIELKNWLSFTDDGDRANLAQAVLALANSGGGYIVLGFEERDGTWTACPQKPTDLAGYSQDAINGIIHAYADPPFHAELHHVIRPGTSDRFPVVTVPGNHTVPIRAKRDGPGLKHVHQNTYYIRRPGPMSAPVQSAREWDELLRRCLRTGREQLLDEIRGILVGASHLTPPSPPDVLVKWTEDAMERWRSLVATKLSGEEPSRYAHGVWTIAYAIEDDFKKPEAQEFVGILRAIAGHETGWPPWWFPTRAEIAPYPFEGLVECWLAESTFGDGAHSDFWRASPEGMLFLLRGHQVDTYHAVDPGTLFDVAVPIWKSAECLLHAERLSARLGAPSARVRVRSTWNGLAGRILTRVTDPWRDLEIDQRICRQAEVTSEVIAQADQIGAALPELISEITRPLYEAFDFYSVPTGLIQSELNRMQKMR